MVSTNHVGGRDYVEGIVMNVSAENEILEVQRILINASPDDARCPDRERRATDKKNETSPRLAAHEPFDEKDSEGRYTYECQQREG